MVCRTLAAMLIAAAPLGCATISRGESHTDDKILRIERSVEPAAEMDVGIEQTESMLHLQGAWRCDLVEVKKIRRTTTYEKKNEDLAPEMVLLALGLVPAAFGVGLIVDSSKVYETDRNARLYNPTGPKAALGGGITLVTVGAAFMTVPIIDLFRSVGSEEEETEVTEKGLPIDKGVPCREPRPFSGITVNLLVGSSTFYVGSTTPQGTLDVDLGSKIPSSLLMQVSPDRAASIVVNGKLAGQVKLGPIFAARRAIDEQQARAVTAGTNPAPIQVAGSPDDIAKAEAAAKAAAEALAKAKKEAAAALEKADKAATEAAERAEKAAAEVCRKKCESSCNKNAACSKACMEEVCP